MSTASRAGLNISVRRAFRRRGPGFYSGSIAAQQRKSVRAGQFDDGADLGFGNLVRVDAAQALALGVDRHHDPVRLGGRLVEDLFEDLDHEVHRRVVVVQQQHLEHLRLLGLVPRPLEDFAAASHVRCLPWILRF